MALSPYWTWWSTHRYTDHSIVSVISPAGVTGPPPQVIKPGAAPVTWQRGARPIPGIPRTCWWARMPVDALPAIGTEIPDPPEEMKKEGATTP